MPPKASAVGGLSHDDGRFCSDSAITAKSPPRTAQRAVSRNFSRLANAATSHPAFNSEYSISGVMHVVVHGTKQTVRLNQQQRIGGSQHEPVAAFREPRSSPRFSNLPSSPPSATIAPPWQRLRANVSNSFPCSTMWRSNSESLNWCRSSGRCSFSHVFFGHT
jgi:hypothetical protein